HGAHGFRRTVAIKTLLPELSHYPEYRAMFLDEACVASQINHPNVAPILDFGCEGELLYLVMEWIEGDSLAALRRAARPIGGVPLHLALRIVSDACLGLHAAHELRDDDGKLLDLVHRDVSPSNLVVASQG